MDTYDIPEHFIPYEDLTAFGEFYFCHLEENSSYPLYQSYEYVFVCGEEERRLNITHDYKPYSKADNMDKLSTYDPQNSDMRYYPDIKTLYCKYENVRFYYAQDVLLQIHWVSHGVGFWLEGEPDLYEYHGDNIPVNMLLNKESVAEFKAMCDDYIAKKQQ